MEITFSCPHCNQQLTADESYAGSQIACPSCAQTLVIPADSRAAAADTHAAQAAMEEVAAPRPRPGTGHKIPMPHSGGGAGDLIQKSKPALDIAVKKSIQLRLKTIRHADCLEGGKDTFDEKVSALLNSIGEDHIISVSPIQHAVLDKAAGAPLTDYGVMVVYKG